MCARIATVDQYIHVSCIWRSFDVNPFSEGLFGLSVGQYGSIGATAQAVAETTATIPRLVCRSGLSRPFM